MSSGEFHNLALTSSGEVYGWGKSELGKLGQDTFMDYDAVIGTDKKVDSKYRDKHELHHRLKNILLPKRMSEIKNVTQISCGVNHSMCINKDNEIYVWDCILTGRLGIRNDNFKLLKHSAINKD